jgi:hypothetical protein
LYRRKQQNITQDDASSNHSESSKDSLHLRIVAAHKFSVVITIEVSYFDTGLQIKEKSLKRIESSCSPSRSTSNDIHTFRLVRSSTKQNFRDFDSILNSNVKNMEEFVLIGKRADTNFNRLMTVHNVHGPSEKEILNRTKHLPLIRPTTSASLNMSIDSAFVQGDLQHDLRKILSEIAKYSAFILGSTSYAEKLIKYYRQKILMSLHNHQDIVKLLVDMGFSRKNVLRALKLQGNNYTLALDWLVENIGNNMDVAATAVVEANGGQSTSTTNNTLESSNDSVENEGDESTFNKFYSKKFPSSNSIFYPKHKAIVSSNKKKFIFAYICSVDCGLAKD